MKTKMNTMVQIDAEDLKNINPVNENLATDLNLPQPSIKGKVFSTADLWKLRKLRIRQGTVVR